MKRITTQGVRLLACLLLAIPSSLFGQGTLIFDEFNGPLDPAWIEFGSTGRVFTDQGRMVMDYRQDLPVKPGVRQSFTPVGNKLFLSFTVNSERNWVNVMLNLLDSQQDTAIQLIIDQGNGNGFLVADAIDPVSGPTSFVKVSDGFAKNQDYEILLEVDILNQLVSVSVDGVLLPAGTDLPFLSTVSDLAELEIYQEYMFNSTGDTTFQNIYFDNFLVSTLDKSQLLILLTQANDLAGSVAIGSQPGQYPQAALTTFTDSIQAAQNIFDATSSSQADIDLAVINLQKAIDALLASQISVMLTYNITPNSGGRQIEENMSGFNVRIIDNTYTYTHPEFRQAIDTLNTGWLRYFSGTTGDAFNARTGLFELEWADQMVREGEINNPNSGFFRHYKLSDAKGAYRLHDLYNLLGENSAKLIVTFNAFTDSPEGAAALAKFCHDNHIIVEDFQICNEPYFFIPGRGHYFYEHGLDYATRVKVVADSIRANYPGAEISLNYDWDGMSRFASGVDGIKAYGTPYWDILGKHSYAAFGQNDDFARAITRMHGGLAYLSEESMQDIANAGWPAGSPIHVTEWNTFNNQLGGTYMNGLYAADYLMRMLDLEDIRYVGNHRLTASGRPKINRAGMIEAAYNGNYSINPDTLLEGLELSPNGPVFRMFNEAINSSTFRYGSSLGGTQIKLPANNQNGSATDVDAIYAQALKGNYGSDYALFSNKSDLPHEILMLIDGTLVTDSLFLTYIVPEDLQKNVAAVPVLDTVTNGSIIIPPYGIMQVRWATAEVVPLAPRIYRAEVLDDAARIYWWRRENAERYVVKYGTNPNNLNQSITIIGNQFFTIPVTGITEGSTYYFEVEAENSQGISPVSNQVSLTIDKPDAPVLAHLHPRNSRINAEWWSIPNATGYKLKYGLSSGNYTEEIDAGNITGARIRGTISGETYYCVVVAYNGEGESEPSNELSVTYLSDIPFAPVNVKASELLPSGDVLVEWAASDSAYGGIHRLYRSTEPYGPWTPVADSITGNSHVDESPSAAGTTYYYSLKTVNQTGESYYFSQAGMVEKQISTSLDQPLTEAQYHPWQTDLNNHFRFYDIVVYDMAGRLILSADSPQSLKNWQSSSNASEGIYVWRLSGELKSGGAYLGSGKFRK